MLNTSMNAASPAAISKISWKTFTLKFVCKFSRAAEIASDPEETADWVLSASSPLREEPLARAKPAGKPPL